MSEINPFSLAKFQFDLPQELIAQSPAQRREASRLLVRDKKLKHTQFEKIGQHLSAGDLLVLNQTKVMPARCMAHKESGGKVEVFVLNMPSDAKNTDVLIKPAKRVPVGTQLIFPNSDQRATVSSKREGQAVLAFQDQQAFQQVLEKDGQIPLPPYIKREQGPNPEDEARYQTVFAKDLGAVAAPTAGLHFSNELLEQLKRGGIEIAYITHHVGIGTFKPVSAEDVRDHQMQVENYIISQENAGILNRAKSNGQRIVAVGTTSTRCLESNFDDGFHAGHFETGLYIYPGYQFQAIDGLITNFHLPGSSLILLVSALIGRESVMTLYREAIAQSYRFYSYGDAMLLWRENNSEGAS